MSMFDKCEQGFENKFVYDEELWFKVIVWCNKLFGLWVVELLGCIGDQVEEYVKEVVWFDFEELGDEDVFCKICVDFDVNLVD